MSTVLDFISDPHLLGPWFDGESWAVHRVALKAANALPLTPPDLEVFHTIAGDRSPPKRRVRILEEIVGRRGGKDAIASAIGTYAATQDYAAILRPGERASVLCLACDRDQASIVLNYTRAYFERCLLLRSMVVRETQLGLELDNGAEIVVATNDYRAVRGRTVVAAILDEAAFYRRDGASTDKDVFDALMPALATVPGAQMVIISSPHARSGLLYDFWRDNWGKDSDEILVLHGASRVFNPTLDQRIIDAALERDPQAAAAEWLAQWRDDLATFIERELIEAAVDRGVAVRPRVAQHRYCAFADPSGGRADSFTAAIAHREGDTAILDAALEIRAPFNPTQAVAEIVALCGSYGLRSITGDKYGAQWVTEAFSKVGFTYVPSERDRSAIYLDCLPLFAAGRARLIDNARLVAQFAGLERRSFPNEPGPLLYSRIRRRAAARSAQCLD